MSRILRLINKNSLTNTDVGEYNDIRYLDVMCM